MALDKLVDSTQLDADITSIADSIRLKTGGTSPLAFPNGMIAAMTPLIDTSDADATAADITKDLTAYVGGEKIIGTRDDLKTETGTIIFAQSTAPDVYRINHSLGRIPTYFEMWMDETEFPPLAIYGSLLMTLTMPEAAIYGISRIGYSLIDWNDGAPKEYLAYRYSVTDNYIDPPYRTNNIHFAAGVTYRYIIKG